jgi:hypothetical protein
MKLREFDLHLVTSDRDVRHAFARQIRCVSALYERCFPGLNEPDARKVLIECVQCVERADVRNLLGVFTLERPFDHPAFERSAPRVKKEVALHTLHRGALAVADALGWPKEPFEVANGCVLERDYLNQWMWPRPVTSPNRKHRAHLVCLHEMEWFKSWLVVIEVDLKCFAAKVRTGVPSGTPRATRPKG